VIVRTPTPLVRLGIVGCGRAALVHHLPALRRSARFTVVALAEPDARRLSEFGARVEGAARYPSAAALLDHADLDAVAVLSPTADHAGTGVAVIEAGRHLFIEKPLALDADECARLQDALQAARVCALVGHNARWHRLVRQARTIIEQGQLGPLKAICSVYTHWHPDPSNQPWHRHRSEGGGVLFNDGVHHFDLWRYLLSTEVADVSARSRRSETYDDDTCVVEACLANGVLASALLSFTTAPSSEVEIFGERGRLSLSLYRFDGLQVMPHSAYDGSLGWRTRQLAHSLAGLPRMLATATRGAEFDRSYTAMWNHFADCTQGLADPACTLTDGRAAVEVACAAIASAGR
jgi:predicted dehydrogenase